MLEKYLDFILRIEVCSHLVFTDEKSMKDIIIYGAVQRNVKKDTNHSHKLGSVNSKNRFNILTAIHTKGKYIRPVEYVIWEECRYSHLFTFLRHLLKVG